MKNYEGKNITVDKNCFNLIPFIVGAIVLGLYGFNTVKSYPLESKPTSFASQEAQCIPPEVSAAFPIVRVSEKGSDQYRLENNPIPPVKPWQYQTSVPKRKESQSTFSGRMILERVFNNHQEIWMLGGYSISSSNSTKTPFTSILTAMPEVKRIDQYEYKIMVFDSTANTWTIVDRKIANSRAYIFDVFTDNNGIVWGLGSKDSNRENGKAWISMGNDAEDDTPEENIVLAKYLEEAHEFIISQASEQPSFRYIPEKLIDSNGNYWFFTPNIFKYSDKLFRYNLVKGDLQIYGSETSKYFSNIQSIQMTAEGELFIRSESTKDLIHFYPSTGKVELEPILPLMDDKLGISHLLDTENHINAAGTGIYLDHNSRLWVEDYGWKEADGRWYQLIHRSPDFIRTGDGILRYTWYRPDPILQSKDGMIWFKNDLLGLTRLNPTTGNWCKMTNMRIDTLLEDSNGDLWLLAGNDLYKYGLQQ